MPTSDTEDNFNRNASPSTRSTMTRKARTISHVKTEPNPIGTYQTTINGRRVTVHRFGLPKVIHAEPEALGE